MTNIGGILADTSINSDLRPLHLARGTDEGFKPLQTIAVVSFQLILAVSVAITGIVLTVSYWPSGEKQCEPYFILLYIHAVFWCVSLIINHHLKLKHDELRINGYLEFYKITHWHVRAPFHIVSMWNAIILVISTIFHQVNDNFESQCKESLINNPKSYLSGIITLEVMVLVPFLGNYIAKVYSFNKTKPSPDVLHDELMANSSWHEDSFDGECENRNHSTLELLEKQADLIRFLKDHNAKLSEKIVQLNSQIRGDS